MGAPDTAAIRRERSEHGRCARPCGRVSIGLPRCRHAIGNCRHLAARIHGIRNRLCALSALRSRTRFNERALSIYMRGNVGLQYGLSSVGDPIVGVERQIGIGVQRTSVSGPRGFDEPAARHSIGEHKAGPVSEYSILPFPDLGKPLFQLSRARRVDVSSCGLKMHSARIARLYN